MVRVGIVITICYTWNNPELLTIFLCELSTQALGRCSEYGVVMMIAITKLVYPISHICYDLQTQFLSLFTLSMMLAYKGDKTLSQTNESDTKSTLVDNTLDSICRSKFVGTYPKALHQQRELLYKGSLLELETIIQLLGCYLKHIIKFCKETVDTFLLIFNSHTLDGKFHDVNR